MILSVSTLLVSEIGGFDEEAFNVHSEGLLRIIFQRGGIDKLHASVANVLDKRVGQASESDTPPILNTYLILAYNISTLHL
jgi:hypothetical protein